MKKTTLFLAIFASLIIAQTGYREPTDASFVPQDVVEKKLQELKKSRQTLPYRVDHSASPYIRPVFNQAGGSCGSASRISYMFAYELNNYRGTSGADSTNMYPSHFTWLLTGQNSGKWQMAKFNGVPNVLEYGGPLYSYELGGNVGWPTDADNQEYGWMQGFNKWRSAMNNRLERTEDVQFKTESDLEYVKWWIYNHHGDDSFNEGAICGGGVASSGWTIKQIPAGMYREGEWVVTQFGPTVDHGVTWSGYDDSIAIDVNSNGTIEDDERGAIIMRNSWGASWKNEGSVYIPYKLLFENNRSSEHYYIRKDYQPVDVFKISMNYNQRVNLKISIGVSSDTLATEPDKVIAAEHFKYAGNGKVPMLGRWADGTMHSESMEFGIDLTDLIEIGFDTRESFVYFLVLETSDSSTGNGVVEELDVIRYNYTSSTDYDSLIAGSKESQTVAVTGAGSKIIIPVKVRGNENIKPDYLYIPQERLSVYSVTTENSVGQSDNVLDGDESTIWHSRWSTGTDPFPHDITIEIDSLHDVNGLEYLPRQDGSSNGRIGEYEVYISENSDVLGTLVDSGTWSNNSSVKYSFFTVTAGKFVTLRAKTDASGNGHTCMAELNLFGTPTGQTEVKQSSKNSLSNLQINFKNSILKLHGIQKSAEIKLFNIKGREIKITAYSDYSKNIATLDLERLAKGIYVISVAENNSTRFLRFVNK